MYPSPSGGFFDFSYLPIDLSFAPLVELLASNLLELLELHDVPQLETFTILCRARTV